ncbi:MAG: sensor histidine kinase, partial [Pseudomonadota bacterium]
MSILSLRMRLFFLIITPLTIISIGLGLWRYQTAHATAQELFDRSLLLAALTISRDIDISGGDALAISTRDMITHAAGGTIFYHARGPSGLYITGYAYPPHIPNNTHTPQYHLAQYRGNTVRVLQIHESTSIDDLTGTRVVTVWQEIQTRETFVEQLAIRTAILFGVLLLTLGLVVWYGVGIGLWPLVNLQNAIDLRSADELHPIRRAVPHEVRGIVRTLNRLLQQVQSNIDTHQHFISNAAHQLRNPAAAILGMAGALKLCKSADERKQRTEELILAAKTNSRLINQLLSLERLRHLPVLDSKTQFPIAALVKRVCAEHAPKVLGLGKNFTLNANDD